MKKTLSKSERLKSRKSIDRLFKEGAFMGKYPLKMAYIIEELNEQKHPTLFAVSVPKKNFKKAVDRNRIKRLVREAFRINCLEAKSKLIDHQKQMQLMFVYQGKDMPTYVQIEALVKSVLSSLEKKL